MVLAILTFHKPSVTGAVLDAVEDVRHFIIRNPLMLDGLEANGLEAINRPCFVDLYGVSIMLSMLSS